MCIASSPSMPPAPTVPPAPPPAPTQADPAVAQAGSDAKKKAAMAGGMQSTILTGAQGLTAPASTTNKTLLGG